MYKTSKGPLQFVGYISVISGSINGIQLQTCDGSILTIY